MRSAPWQWGYLYDLLHEIEVVADVTLANPSKTRIIAEAKIKTDSRPKGESQPQAARRASEARQP